MNRNDKRRLEFSNPESMLTLKELEYRKDIVKNIIKIGSSISLIFMVLGAYIIALISVQYRGIEGFTIAFFGSILDVITGILLAYHLGTKMQIWYVKNVIQGQ